MTSHHRDDPVLREVGALPVLTPDPRRAARVRSRCLARQRRASATTARLAPAIFAAACAIYLAAVVVDILRVHAG